MSDDPVFGGLELCSRANKKFEALKEQVTSVHAIYRRTDVFVWLPTAGFVKTVCYDVLHFVFEHPRSYSFLGSRSVAFVATSRHRDRICTVTLNTIHMSS